MSPTRRGHGGGETWYDSYVGSHDKESRDVARKQADVVAQDMHWATIAKKLLQFFVGTFLVFLPAVLLVIYYLPVSSTASLQLALIVFVLNLARGAMVSLPGYPVMYTFLVVPFWTMMVARRGNKFGLTSRACVLFLVYGGFDLLWAYLAGQLIKMVLPGGANMAMTDPTVPTQTVKLSVYMLSGLIPTVILWFDVLGLNHEDGPWFSLASAKDNPARDWRDRVTYASIQAFIVLFTGIVLGEPLVLDPEVLFATWSANTSPPAGSLNYGQVFEYLFLFGCFVPIVILSMFTWLCGDQMHDLMYGLWSGRKSPKHHRSRERKEGEGETEETTAEGSESATDED